MKKSLAILLSILCLASVLALTVLPISAQETLTFKNKTILYYHEEIPSYLAEATTVNFADTWVALGSEDFGTTNARCQKADEGNIKGLKYVYLKDDKRGDYTVPFTVAEAGYYNMGIMFLNMDSLGSNKIRATKFQIDNSEWLDIRFTSDVQYTREYAAGFCAYLTAGQHSVTLSLPDDFDNDTIKTLFISSFMYQKTTEDFVLHNFGAWEVVTASTCTVAGKAVHKCLDCTFTEEKQLPLANHSEKILEAKAATCTATGLTVGKICSVCQTVLKKQEVTEQKNHNFGEWKTTVQPTLEAEGEQARKCKDCDATEKQAVAKLSAKTETEETNTNKPAAESNATVVIVIVIVAVLVLAGGGAFLLIKKKKNA